MVKQKLNVSDISVLINEFNRDLFNARLTNVYDINNRCFLLKLTKDSKEKEFVLIDSNPQAPRFHVTRKESLCNAKRRTLPSSFCAKLRKHLINKKLTKITQLGMDRVIDLQFGSEAIYHIIVELYDSGNLVLTDPDYNILTLVRRYNINKDQEDELNIKVGVKYPIENANSKIMFTEELNNKLHNLFEITINQGKKNSLRNILISASSPIVNFGKDMIVHSLLKNGWNLNKKYSVEQLKEFNINDFFVELERIYKTLDIAKGYIIKDNDVKIDFSPLKYYQFEKMEVIEYPDLSSAIDDYFQVKMEDSKNDKQKQDKKSKDDNKVERVEKSIREKINQLDSKREESLLIAEYLSNNFDEFKFLENFNPNEKSENINIKNLNKKDKLIDYYVESLDLIIKLDYTVNIWNNIKNFHTDKKDFKSKISKTEISGQKAIDRLKAEENKSQKKIKQSEPKINLPQAKEFWFQKFKWFLSSEGYLVILGKDMHQNETLVKKHLDKNDIYLHSDVHGSGSCIVKNIISDTNKEPSIKTMLEAGSFIICNTKAWKSNSPDKAFWVYPDQVSKTPQTGEYVSTGSFIIRGKKNYLTTSLQLGYGILFKNPGEMNINNIEMENKNDKVEWAFPMVGPYSSFKNFKFKVKLLPGNGKKGKTFKKIMDVFCKKKEINNLEKLLIKKIDTGVGSDILISGINLIN